MCVPNVTWDPSNKNIFSRNSIGNLLKRRENTISLFGVCGKFRVMANIILILPKTKNLKVLHSCSRRQCYRFFEILLLNSTFILPLFWNNFDARENICLLSHKLYHILDGNSLYELRTTCGITYKHANVGRRLGEPPMSSEMLKSEYNGRY